MDRDKQILKELKKHSGYLDGIGWSQLIHLVLTILLLIIVIFKL